MIDMKAPTSCSPANEGGSDGHQQHVQNDDVCTLSGMLSFVYAHV